MLFGSMGPSSASREAASGASICDALEGDAVDFSADEVGRMWEVAYHLGEVEGFVLDEHLAAEGVAYLQLGVLGSHYAEEVLLHELHLHDAVGKPRQTQTLIALEFAGIEMAARDGRTLV